MQKAIREHDGKMLMTRHLPAGMCAAKVAQVRPFVPTTPKHTHARTHARTRARTHARTYCSTGELGLSAARCRSEAAVFLVPPHR